jgi:UDP-glucose 4-epimerase
MRRPRTSTDLGIECPPVATLLTGVGYIGAALLCRLAERDPDEAIVALDNFFSTSRAQAEAALPPGTRLVDGDVADPAAVARAFQQVGDGRDIVVYHLAAQPSAAIAAREPEITERSNLVGARVVLEAALERGARVVFGGSFRVYGDDLHGQTVSEHTPYGRVGDLSHLSKVYVEQLARMLGVRFVSLRLGITYGLSPIMKTRPELMTVPNVFCLRAAHGEDLRVLEDRPMAFIHVRDAADALIAAADALLEMGETAAATAENRTWWVVNAAPEVATIGHVARTVQQLVRARGGDVRIAGAAASEAEFRVHSSLDFVPRCTLADGLGEVLDSFMQPR